MDRVLRRGGQAAGLAGILLIVASVALRLAGYYTLGGYAVGTLLLAGTALVAVGCFLLLWLLAARLRP